MARPLEVAGPVFVEPDKELGRCLGPAVGALLNHILEEVAFAQGPHRDRKVGNPAMRRERFGQCDE